MYSLLSTPFLINNLESYLELVADVFNINKL